MTDFTFRSHHTQISITGYIPRGGLVRDRYGVKPHDGPTMELTITAPHDDTEVINVPYPLGAQALRKRLAFYGALLLPAEGRALEYLILKFANYVINNHGWSRPYQHQVMDT